MEDARFEDGEDQALRLRAETPEDLQVVSALLQDAVGEAGDISWMPRQRRFAMLVNRFRWEDYDEAQSKQRPYERVRSLLVIEDVLRVQGSGIDATDKDLVLSLLSISFEAGEDLAGRIGIVLAGHGDIAVNVECINVLLADVTQPYLATSSAAPSHRLVLDE